MTWKLPRHEVREFCVPSDSLGVLGKERWLFCDGSLTEASCCTEIPCQFCHRDSGSLERWGDSWVHTGLERVKQEMGSTKSSCSPSLTLPSYTMGRSPSPRFSMQDAQTECTFSGGVSMCPPYSPSYNPCCLAIWGGGLSLFIIIVATILLGSPLDRTCSCIH